MAQGHRSELAPDSAGLDYGRTAPAAHGDIPASLFLAPNDEFVYHAIGAADSRVVAAGIVRSTYRHDPDVDSFDFPFACDVEVRIKRNLLADGVRLEELNVPGMRDLRRSITQKSHIRLTEEEFDRAIQALGV